MRDVQLVAVPDAHAAAAVGIKSQRSLLGPAALGNPLRGIAGLASLAQSAVELAGGGPCPVHEEPGQVLLIVERVVKHQRRLATQAVTIGQPAVVGGVLAGLDAGLELRLPHECQLIRLDILKLPPRFYSFGGPLAQQPLALVCVQPVP